MGIIEDSIFAVYRKALEEGNMEQAQHTVDLVKLLRSKIDAEGFIDLETSVDSTPIFGNFFEPYQYRYHEENNMVVIGQSAILLTKSENNFFKLLTENETQGTDMKPITHEMIRAHLWGEKKVTTNALRLSIKRIRAKIEPNPDKPKMFINFYQKGYLFLGKRVI